MAYNGSGVFTPDASYFPAVAGALIESAKFNGTITDIATGLSTALTKDGQTTPTANIALGGFKVTGAANGSARTDYATIGQAQDGTLEWAGTAGGTADAITLTLTPSITAYAAGQSFTYKSGASVNTTAMTVNVSALGTKAIQKNGAALAAGDHPANMWFRITYDGAAFQLLQLSPTTAAVTTALALKANLASPTFTGTPLSTTAAVDTSTTQIATTAFVTNQAASATPLADAVTAVVGVSERYARGDHVHPKAAISSIARVATTSTTLIALTAAIPSWVKRITLTFTQVSTTGGSPVLVQIGDSGGIEASGYTSGYGNNNAGSSAGAAVTSAGFMIPGVAATDTRSGTLTLTLNDATSNTWTAAGAFYVNATQVGFCAGDKALTATLDRISVTTAGGVDTFDNGTIGILYE